MAFDPSVIQQAADTGFDPAGAQAKALTLSDLYDQSKLNKIKVKDAQTQQSDMSYARQILGGKDLTKLEGQNAAVAEITKRNPQLGMELMKSFQQQQAGQTNLDRAQLDLYQAKNEIIGSSMYQLKAKHDQLIAQGATEQQVHDAMSPDLFSTITQLREATLPNGKPLLEQQDFEILRRGFGQGYNPGFVDQAVSRSAQARQALADKYKAMDEARKDKDEGRKEKATNAAIAAGQARTAQGLEGKLEQEDADWMADQYLAGDKSVLTGLGRGRQGPGNIIEVRRAIRTRAQAKGMNPTDVAARLAEYNGFVSEQRAMGTQQANVEMASSEAEQMIQNARQASADVPRGSFLPWTKISQMSDKQLNDAKLASLKAATTAVINTWSRAINPKGVATVADKDHGYELLNAAQDQDAYNAVLDRFEQEAQASLAAPASAKQRLHDAFVGSQSSTAGGKGTSQAPPPGGTSPPAAGTPSAAPGRGAPPAGGPAAIPPPPGFVLQD